MRRIAISGAEMVHLESRRIPRRDLAAIYLRALRNEIAVDLDGYSAIRDVPANLSYLPRFSSIWPRLRRFPRLAGIGHSLLHVAWRHGLFALFFAKQYLALRKAGGEANGGPYDRGNAGVASGQSVQLLLSALAPDLIARVRGSDETAFIVPWQDYPNGTPQKHVTTINDLLSRSDMRACLLDAIAIAWRIPRRKTPFRVWHLQTYTLFRWLCVARSLERLDCEGFAMANHYDRWAILVDRIAGQRRKRLTLVQHGIEAYRRLPTKLHFVDTLYVFNHQEEELFKAFILDQDITDSVNVRFFDTSLAIIEPEPMDDRVRVVIVGHPEFDVQQVRLMQRMAAARKDIRLIYKPHPTARGVAREIRALAEIWTTKGSFPRCELVLSYASTLAHQCRDAGMKTYIHGTDVDEAEIAAVIELIPAVRDF